VVLEQADKLKAEIAQMEEEIKTKRKQLVKFEEARKLFEGMHHPSPSQGRSSQSIQVRRRQQCLGWIA